MNRASIVETNADRSGFVNAGTTLLRVCLLPLLVCVWVPQANGQDCLSRDCAGSGFKIPVKIESVTRKLSFLDAEALIQLDCPPGDYVDHFVGIAEWQYGPDLEGTTRPVEVFDGDPPYPHLKRAFTFEAPGLVDQPDGVVARFLVSLNEVGVFYAWEQPDSGPLSIYQNKDKIVLSWGACFTKINIWAQGEWNTLSVSPEERMDEVSLPMEMDVLAGIHYTLVYDDSGNVPVVRLTIENEWLHQTSSEIVDKVHWFELVTETTGQGETPALGE